MGGVTIQQVRHENSMFLGSIKINAGEKIDNIIPWNRNNALYQQAQSLIGGFSAASEAFNFRSRDEC